MTKSRSLLIVLMLALIPLAVITGDHAAYMALYALAALLAAALASVIMAPFLIKVEENADKRYLSKNEELIYTAKASAKFFALYPKVEFTMHNSALVSYNRRGAAHSTRDGLTGEYALSFPYRGKYSVGVERVAVTDFLGILRLTFPIKNMTQVLVYPERDETFTLNLNAELLNKAATQFDIFDYVDADVSDVRKYTPSDDYRKIHWKLSAKRGEIIIKNYQSAMLNKTILLLDTRPPQLKGAEKPAFEDKAASLAASAANFLLKSRLPAEIIYGGGRDDAAGIDSVSDLETVLRLLAGLEFAPGNSIISSMDGSVARDGGLYNIIIFLTDVDDNVFTRLKHLISHGHNLVIYLVHPPGSAPRGDKEAGIEGIRAMGVDFNFVVGW